MSWANSWGSLNAHGGGRPVPPLQGGTPATSPLEPGQRAQASSNPLGSQPEAGSLTLRAAPPPPRPAGGSRLPHPLLLRGALQVLGGTLESSRVTTRPTSSLHSGVLGLCASRSLENCRGTTWNWSGERQRRASGSVLRSGALPAAGGHPSWMAQDCPQSDPVARFWKTRVLPVTAAACSGQGPPHRPAPSSDHCPTDDNDERCPPGREGLARTL